MAALFSNESEFTSAGVVVPDKFLSEYTSSLVAIRDGCQLALEDVLREREIELNPINVEFQEWLAEQQERVDLINYFAFEPDGYLINNIRGVLKDRRAHTVGLFSAKPLDEDWLKREGLRSIILTPNCDEIPIYIKNIVDFETAHDYIPKLMEKLSDEAMQRKIL